MSSLAELADKLRTAVKVATGGRSTGVPVRFELSAVASANRVSIEFTPGEIERIAAALEDPLRQGHP